MTHEFKKILLGYQNAQRIGLQSVLATVVDLVGSSYRRPGVQMLITENGQMIGAVSGGCVEKEVLQQACTVFKTGIPKMITYDGRYRLGCEGILYILIEPFQPDLAMVQAFETSLQQRTSFEIKSAYSETVGVNTNLGSSILFAENKKFMFDAKRQERLEQGNSEKYFSQTLKPCFRLVIIGAEHDAGQLVQFASLLGWDVTVVTSISDSKCITDFPGAQKIVYQEPDVLNVNDINNQTAIVLMTHSYVKDLRYLLALKNTLPAYIGLLGPAKRRERLLNEFVEHHDRVEESFFDLIHGPAGINIGAETPQEIAISICAEILAVIRKQTPEPLKNKKGTIHCDL